MQFVKTHWISLLCGVVALAGIAVAVLGMMNDDVLQELEKRKEAAAKIRSLRGDPHNEETINAEKERGEKFEQQYKQVVATAEQINEKQPLLEGVFPKPAQLAAQYRFREVYLKAIYDLPRQMKAGGLPTEAELRDAAEVLAEIERRKQQEAGEDDELVPPPTSFTPPAGGLTPPGGMTGGRGRMAPPGGRGRMSPGTGRGRMSPGAGRGRMAPPSAGGRMAGPGPGGMLPGAPAGAGAPEVSQDKVSHRASVKKARGIRVYASAETALHISPLAYTKDAPTPRSMWYAQVSLWIQEDMVRAIARLNDEAAERLGDDEESNVANMPVKRVENIQVLGYVRSDGIPVPIPSAGPQAETAPLGPSFTGSRSTDQFDVVRVGLAVIVDERELIKLIDSVTRSNFYQLVGAEYSLVQVNEQGYDAEGYIYGPAPVIRAVLDFEGFMARKLFKEKMPAEVLLDLGITKPEGQGG